MWTLKYLHEFCDDDDHLVLCLTICLVLSLGTSQKPSEIVQLREFNKELVTKVLDGPESLTGERGEAQWEAIAESLYPPPLGFGETNRGIELTDPWSHLPQIFPWHKSSHTNGKDVQDSCQWPWWPRNDPSFEVGFKIRLLYSGKSWCYGFITLGRIQFIMSIF